MKFSVYAIVDPRDQLVFYVGHSGRFDLRCQQHREGNDSLSGLTIQQIRQSGHEPIFVKLELCATRDLALMAEIFWIEQFKRAGVRLMNAQGFPGYVARAEERGRLKDGLEGLAGLRSTESIHIEAVATGRPSRWGQAWSRKELTELTRLAGEGLSPAEIADQLGRTIAGVETRLGTRAPQPKKSITKRRRRKPHTLH